MGDLRNWEGENRPKKGNGRAGQNARYAKIGSKTGKSNENRKYLFSINCDEEERSKEFVGKGM
jgi:hypothetical protein